MLSLIRKLEIYWLTGIGNFDVIITYQWINETFHGLTITKRSDGCLEYTKNNSCVITQNKECKYFIVNGHDIWIFFNKRYNISHSDTKEIIRYIMFKFYKIKNANKYTFP